MLVVFEEDVIFRLELFDQVGFERKCLGLVRDTDVFKVRNLAHHGGDFRRMVL